MDWNGGGKHDWITDLAMVIGVAFLIYICAFHGEDLRQ